MGKYQFNHAGDMHQEGNAVHKPMIKPSHKGMLHKEMGIPQDQKIPMDRLMAAKNSSNPKIRKQANFAINFGHKK